MDKLTLEDSFRELIKQRKWYVNSLRSPIQAKYDKATFQKGGKVPEERIRDYLLPLVGNVFSLNYGRKHKNYNI